MEDKQINYVVMDSIIEKILVDSSINSNTDIFELINEHLGEEYSIEDLTEYIQDKESIKKRLAMIFVAQNYARSYIGKIVLEQQLEDLF